MGCGTGGGGGGKLLARLAEQWAEWDAVLEAWLDREDSEDAEPEWKEDVRDLLVNGHENWDLYTLSAASEWATLPEAGGWLDQADSFLHDISVFSRRIAHLRAVKKANKLARENAERRLGIRDRIDEWRRRH